MEVATLALAAASAACALASALLAPAPRGGGRGRPPLTSAPGELLSALARNPLVSRALAVRELRERRADALRQMPTLLDIVTLGLSAGLSFDASLELYCQRYHTRLAASFNEALLSWRIGSRTRAEALAGLADELGVAALGRFASAVSEALAFGTPLAAALEQQAQGIRDEQRAQVEEEMEKVPVKMLIPLGTLILPAMLLAILGPLVGPALGM